MSEFSCLGEFYFHRSLRPKHNLVALGKFFITCWHHRVNFELENPIECETVIYAWHEGLRELIFAGSPRGSSPLLLEHQRSYFLTCQLPFLALTEVTQAWPGDAWGEVKNSKQPNSSFTGSSVKSSSGSPQNSPKAYLVNGRWRWHCTMLISPDILH